MILAAVILIPAITCPILTVPDDIAVIYNVKPLIEPVDVHVVLPDDKLNVLL